MPVTKPKGTEDLIGADAILWSYMREVAEQVFTAYGYLPVEVPLIEQADVFVHGLGTATDVVRKEMFTALSPDAYAKVSEGRADALKADQRLALRPEGTAGTVRAVIEHNLAPAGSAPVKLWYAGSMFRAERPQKGRLREFHQIGAECLGTTDAASDAETIVMFMRFVEQLGIPASSVRLLLNSMGDDACRPAYRASVASYIRAHEADLCDECRRRADTNPLRAFDCKNERCHEVMEGAPKISYALCDDCRSHYQAVKRYLDLAGIAYEEDPRLVRGLDYYTRTVFEVQVSDGLGSQNAIGGGGRYDKLVETSGGKPTPGLGFAAGFERLVLAMQAAGAPTPEPVRPDAYVAATGPEVAEASFTLVQTLRDAGFIVEADRQARSLKSQFKQADKLGVGAVVVLGPDELAAGRATLRDMGTHEERQVALAEVPYALAELLGLAVEEDGCGCGCADHDHDHDHGETCGCGCC
jgi:histidyl-tRNA synthetase